MKVKLPAEEHDRLMRPARYVKKVSPFAILRFFGCTNTIHTSQSLYLFSEQCSVASFQNRYNPIVVFFLHVYWRINRSLDNPVRMKPYT